MSHKINHFLKLTIKQKKKTYPLSHYFSTFALHFLTYNKNIKRTTKPDKGLTNRKFNMLSILIPVYNYDCSELIKALHLQGERLKQSKGGDYEIIVGDDASSKGHGVENVRKACNFPECRFLSPEKNRGRAANRNAMAREAKGNYLLFIDCDALVTRGDFLEKYYEETLKGAEVVIGGIEAVGTQPSPDVSLRFKYEQSAAEIRSLEYRKANPYSHFSTFNVMVKTEVFMHIRFDESCVGYGYEDTIFGLRLKQEGYNITHIDAPLVHNGLDTNREFVEKTEQSMRNLHRFGRDIQNFSHVGAVALRLKRLNLDEMIVTWHRLFGRIERANLLSNNPSLFVLKLYKLGFFCSL